MGLKSKYRQWRVAHADNARAKGMQGQQSVALGFAWRAANIGGVRRHLECIEKYSQHAVALYPSTPSHDFLKTRDERSQYHADLGDPLIDRHSLFHSHVDPDFIAIAQRAQKAGKPWLHTYHLLYFPEDWDNNLAPWQQKINDCLLTQASKADLCLSVGTWLVDWLEENHGIETQFVPNGVDVDACDQADGNRFREAIGLDNFVLFVNSIAKVKNPAAFVEAARARPDQKFVMIGTNLTAEGIRAELKIDVPPNLIALGPLSHAQTLDAMSACKTFVMTSHREGLPTVLLEAMSMGKVCVAPRLPWSSDAIRLPEHGFLYDPEDPQDLVKTIDAATELEVMPMARQHVVDSFSWPVVARQLDDIYSGQLSSSARC
ncbi:UDP-D-galactose:(glucosyl)lipopolysaccharide-1,6-D-galactosyltransferase [Rosistilla carotiformis]|uniref:UDP-D-galactose:(Glucosyl)lipopolysaccharide-1, 6-D-galactosyltransferase n=1 Tax=Rosistilla carotiformis TaxID=2528017 RepID=A0A518JVG8_9BACT|nr:glycosyltransferase family 4 protein [Rosistilla carotiformis]QDV69540.1 UDP-D-galactose:(glucosyl)lipopolysaccharide-1,6-D-galactosyltransferase [Rosistilla carotiformis]